MEAYSGAYLNSTTNDMQNRTDESLSLYREQIEKDAGPFCEIRDNRYVVLEDAQAVRAGLRSALRAWRHSRLWTGDGRERDLFHKEWCKDW